MYFFQLTLPPDEVLFLAAVSVFTMPDADLLMESAYTLRACFYQGQNACEVIRPTDIVSVVAMVPLPQTHLDTRVAPAGYTYADRYFVVEKPGLDVAFMAGHGEEQEEGDLELDDLMLPS